MNVHHAMVRNRLLKPNFALDKLVSHFCYYLCCSVRNNDVQRKYFLLSDV